MKVILDLDTGIDDALALAYILASPEVELLAVTGTFGNVTVAEGVANTRALLAMLGRSDIPVYAGRPHALTATSFEVLPISRFIHGDNGVGGVTLPPAESGAAGEAAPFLVEAAREHPDLIIVATGPLTNIADAVQLAPDFTRAQVVVMGGALTVPGNVTPWSEANIYQDPEAADIVFRSELDVTMIGLDVTHQTVLTRADTAEWRGLSTPGDLLADIADYYIGAYATTAPHLRGCALHDPLAAAVAVDPTLVMCLPLHLTVDLTEPTRGRTIGAGDRVGPEGATSRVAVGVASERFHTTFVTRLRDLVAGF
ncbi:nucleoside hydrolase [Corynebacterium hindlerae]|uniref:nucleoside hydrolase n=1 Tax=Corynebacterium hindlerae TaxID=699041 RepID=UPI0031B6A3DB